MCVRSLIETARSWRWLSEASRRAVLAVLGGTTFKLLSWVCCTSLHILWKVASSYLSSPLAFASIGWLRCSCLTLGCLVSILSFRPPLVIRFRLNTSLVWAKPSLLRCVFIWLGGLYPSIAALPKHICFYPSICSRLGNFGNVVFQDLIRPHHSTTMGFKSYK